MASPLTERCIDRTLELLYRDGFSDLLNHPRPELRRVRAGHHQRSAGAWSWYLFPYLWCGSCWSARTVALAKTLVLHHHPHIYTVEVIVEDGVPIRHGFY